MKLLLSALLVATANALIGSFGSSTLGALALTGGLGNGGFTGYGGHNNLNALLALRGGGINAITSDSLRTPMIANMLAGGSASSLSNHYLPALALTGGLDDGLSSASLLPFLFTGGASYLGNGGMGSTLGTMALMNGGIGGVGAAQMLPWMLAGEQGSHSGFSPRGGHGGYGGIAGGGLLTTAMALNNGGGLTSESMRTPLIANMLAGGRATSLSNHYLPALAMTGGLKDGLSSSALLPFLFSGGASYLGNNAASSLAPLALAGGISGVDAAAMLPWAVADNFGSAHSSGFHGRTHAAPVNYNYGARAAPVSRGYGYGARAPINYGANYGARAPISYGRSTVGGLGHRVGSTIGHTVAAPAVVEEEMMIEE